MVRWGQLARFFPKRLIYIATLLVLGLTTTNGKNHQDEHLQNQTDRTTTKTSRSPIVTLSGNYCTGWITSKVYTSNNTYSWQYGQAFDVSLKITFSSGIGVGVDYEHSWTQYPAGHNSYSRITGNDENLKIDYVGPSVYYGMLFGTRFYGRAELGIGYAHHDYMNQDKQSGVGMKCVLGIDYVMSDHFSVGLELERLAVNLPDRDNSSSKKYYDDGFQRFSINVGLRVRL